MTGDFPAEAIVAAAKRRKCDLIFMASHSRSGLPGAAARQRDAQGAARVESPGARLPLASPRAATRCGGARPERLPVEEPRHAVSPRSASPMKNLLVLHLESITRQRLDVFASSFPNTRRLHAARAGVRPLLLVGDLDADGRQLPLPRQRLRVRRRLRVRGHAPGGEQPPPLFAAPGARLAAPSSSASTGSTPTGRRRSRPGPATCRRSGAPTTSRRCSRASTS